MFKTVSLMLLVLLAAPLYARQSTNHTGEEEAIKATVFEETQAFYGGDIDGVRSVWLHDSKTSRTIVQGALTQTQVGWESIGPGFESIAEWDPVPVEIHNANHLITTNGEMAWVEYDQTLTFPDDPSAKRTSKEMRLLVKQAGAWKIMKQVTYDTFANALEATEVSLNETGYGLLNAGKVEEAIRVFTLNTELYPASWNAYDSLGEAYMKAGDKKKAIEHYEKSLALNPENGNGKDMLAKLKEQR